MATITAVSGDSLAINHERPEVLTDDQIEQLLQEAEARLREKAALVTAGSGPQSPYQHQPIPKLQHGLTTTPYITEQDGVAKADRKLAVTDEQRKMANGLRTVEKQQGSRKTNDVTTSGSDWFNLPKTELTPQLKRDLQLIEMRSVLDPHRHYKKNNRRGKVPTFSHVGTVIEGPTEFFSGRLNKKDRSKNFVEEAMKIEAENGRFKRKYGEIQDKKTSGKKAHYKKLLAKRKKS